MNLPYKFFGFIWTLAVLTVVAAACSSGEPTPTPNSGDSPTPYPNIEVTPIGSLPTPNAEIVFTAVDHFNIGLALKENGQIAEAIAEFGRALLLDPDYTLAYNQRGTSHSRLGQYEEALNDFDAAIRLDPEFAEAYNNRGVAYFNINQPNYFIEVTDR